MANTLLWPIQGTARITSPFGYRTGVNPLQRNDFHTGIDFGVPMGTPIYATMSGTFSAENNRGGGLVLRVRGPNGWETRYAHTSRAAVKAGTWVRAGQIIGYSGMSGEAVTGPHLHYEVLQNGKFLDPRFARPVSVAAPFGLGKGLGFQYDQAGADDAQRMSLELQKQEAERERSRQRSVMADFADISRTQRQQIDSTDPSAIRWGSRLNTRSAKRPSRFA